MQIFEYPYIIITIFVLCFILLAGMGIYFAIKGMKTANDRPENDFTSIGKMESKFEKSGKLREDRCVLYIGVSLENFRNLHSEEETTKVFSGIKTVLLNSFSIGEKCAVSPYGEKNFVSLANWSAEDAEENIKNAISELNKCLLNSNALSVVEIKIGFCSMLGTQVSFDEAISRAKQACMLAKNKKTSYESWDTESGKALEKKIKIENNIEREIDNNRFFLEYQPVLDAKTKKIIGAEVLSRLNSENDGVLTPKNFLSAVDTVGINDKFDYYIFEKNCKWISNNKLQREGYRYTINFSRTTLCDPQFAQNIISIVKKYELDFSCLAIEILEDKNIVGEARERMINNLSTLKNEGMSILLDDFGSGFTTFSDLQNLDISIVKVDKQITKNSTTDTGFIILKNLIQTSKDIGFKTLCEGIETKEQEEAAIKAGCDMLQGYYYYKPMPVAQLDKLFNENQRGV